MLSSRHKLGWESPYREISSLKEGDIVHLPTGVAVTQEQLIHMVSGARIIYVGESHDNMNAHKVQLEILKALQERNPGKVAVGMEMLRRPSQAVADQWTSGELDEKEFMRAWVEDWSNDFSYYRDILNYVRENHISLLALRASEAWMEELKKPESSQDSDPGEEKQEVLPEMDVEDIYHQSHIKAIFSAHPKHAQNFDEFYKVQVLWDESMAQSIYEYLVTDEGADKQVVIFAGSQHIEHGFGIPRRVFRRLPLSYAIVLPVMIGDIPEERPKLTNVTLPEVPLLPGDFAWMITYEDLEDERVYLGVMIKGDEEGVKIIGMTKNSAAEKAGLQKDDVITVFDGEPIKTSFDLTYLIGLKKAGDKGTLEVLREEKPLSFEVTFEEGGFHR
jgi:uncharacterized iron-regulated protein